MTPKIPFTSYREKVTKRETGYSNTHDEELIDDIGPLPNKKGVSKLVENKYKPNFKIAAKTSNAKEGLNMTQESISEESSVYKSSEKD